MHAALYLVALLLLAGGCRGPTRPQPAERLHGPTPQGLFLGTNPHEGFGTALVMADWDGDGLDDLLAAAVGNTQCSPGCARVELRFGRADGLRSDPDHVLRGQVGMGAALAAGDFDLDGTPDLAVSSSSGQLGVWRGRGRDGFGPEIPLGDLPSGVDRPAWSLVAQSRAEGALLLSLGVRSRGRGESPAVALLGWRWNGEELEPTWTPSDEPRIPQLRSRLVSAGDLDGDGVADSLMLAPAWGPPGRPPPGAAWIVPGTSVGFGPPTRLALPGGGLSMYPMSAASVGDLDGDGRAELLLGSEAANLEGANLGPDREGVIQLHGGRSLTSGPVWTLSGGSMDAGLGREIAAGCTSRSGRATAAVVSGSLDNDSWGRASLRVFEFDSSFGASEVFRAEPQLSSAGFGTAMAIGDTDGDGVCEVFVGTPGYRTDLRRGAVIAYRCPEPVPETERPPAPRPDQ